MGTAAGIEITGVFTVFEDGGEITRKGSPSLRSWILTLRLRKLYQSLGRRNVFTMNIMKS
jgi:hypothetical protein